MTDTTTDGRPPEQVYFPGMHPPDEPDVEEVKTAIYAWLNAKVEQKRAGEAIKTAHAAMLAQLAEHKLEWHPYLDPYTQKRRRVWIAKEPKAKTTSIPKPRKEGKQKRGRNGERPERDDSELVDEKVEVRRVPRASVEKEIDPFAATRGAMDNLVAFNPPKVSKGKKPK